MDNPAMPANPVVRPEVLETYGMWMIAERRGRRQNGKAVVTADNRKHINGRNPEIAGAVTKPNITANGQINSSRYNVLSDIDFVSEKTGADNVSIEGLQPRVRDFKKGKEVYGRVDVQGNHGHQGGPRNGKALVEARVNGRKILCVITGLCKKRIGMGPRLP